MTETIPQDTIRLEDYDREETAPVFVRPASLLEDHARITPINSAARKAFHEIALIMKTDETWNSHIRRFIHIDDLEANDDVSDSDSSNEEASFTPRTSPLMTGYFRINLSILPVKFANGWVIGAGRNRPTDANVDLLISVDGHRDNVRSRHARLVYHQESRVPMIGALPKKIVILNGQEIRDQAHVLAHTQSIIIGDLAYRLEFLRVDKVRYLEALDMILARNKSWQPGNHSSFDPTPSNNHFELHGYQFQTPQAAGAYGVVSPCFKISTGNLYAVKRVQRTISSFGVVNTELSVMEHIGKHPHVCNLFDTFYSDGDRLSLGGSSVNDVYLILEPWAPKALSTLIYEQASREKLTTAFHQAAQGIRHLHRMGVIHRDIKLNNLLIASHNPMRVVIADFGHAIISRSSGSSSTRTNPEMKNHMKGTISYHAPEITALKDGTDMSGCWSKASDVFSFAVVGFELFHGKFKRSPKHNIDLLIYQLMHERLSSESDIDKLLASMLLWRPVDRPTMDYILLRPLWLENETSISLGKRKAV